MQIGLYIHIPFCASKCYYCDFLSFRDNNLQESYIDAMISEMKSASKDFEVDTTVKSIFIGGGTPTVLPTFLLDKLMESIVRCFKIEEDAEWTIEANPGTIDIDKINVLKKYPINRISLGLQTTHSHLLKTIGRIHSFNDWKQSIELIQRNTKWDINTDLMFSLPSQTLKEFKDTLEIVASYDLSHISIYSLIVEEGTKIYDWVEEGKLNMPDEELDRQMYYYAKEYLMGQGYIQYEISNWSKPNKESKHNIVYWRMEDYLGIGLGAHSFIKNRRYYNETSKVQYINANGNLNIIRHEEELVTSLISMQEYMFLGLRMIDGISISEFHNKYNISIWDQYGDQLNKWLKYDILIQNQDRLYLSCYGLDVCNEVFSSFL